MGIDFSGMDKRIRAAQRIVGIMVRGVNGQIGEIEYDIIIQKAVDLGIFLEVGDKTGTTPEFGRYLESALLHTMSRGEGKHMIKGFYQQEAKGVLPDAATAFITYHVLKSILGFLVAKDIDILDDLTDEEIFNLAVLVLAYMSVRVKDRLKEFAERHKDEYGFIRK